MSSHTILDRAARLRQDLPVDLTDVVVTTVYEDAGRIARDTISSPETGSRRPTFDQALDRALTHRVWGFVMMGALFYAVFWFTITGAALPSDLLYTLLDPRTRNR